MRLQKYLAHAGVGSRRECESLIRAGRVMVNGSPAEIGMSVDPDRDQVLFDGRQIQGKESQVYLVLNKPPGVLCSRTSQGGLPTVLDLVQVTQRVYPVGRLDADSTGLVLLTNDGDLTYRLTHPKFEREKEYRVLLDRKPAESDLEAWRLGMAIPGFGRTSPAAVQLEKSSAEPWIRVVLHEGKNREIRRVAEVLGYQVRQLVRVRIGSLELGGLEEGGWRQLTRDEVTTLRDSREPVGQEG